MKMLLLLFIALIRCFSISAQSMNGFWAVDEVTVGNQILTPVAKWYKFNADKTYQAGNGWTQNDIGDFTFKKSTKSFLPNSFRNLPDPYGEFKVSFDGDRMYWQRTEDNMPVKVTLHQIEAMPMAPVDSIAGRWDLISVKKDGNDITSSIDPDDKISINIRWTKTYAQIKSDGSKAFGYWHMDVHDPEFHLIDFNQEIGFQVFTVSFQKDNVFLRPKNDPDLVYIYENTR